MRESPKELHGIPWAEWLAAFPQLADLSAGRPTYWNNIHSLPTASALTSCGFTAQDVEDAALRLERFAPLIAALFPETAKAKGVIESPLHEAKALQEELQRRYGLSPVRRLLVKLDGELPVSGSVKARGGIYEVLKLAEDLAMRAQLIKWSDNYTKMLEPEIRDLFGGYTVAVGSTGNLGLAVGSMGLALGFKARVHMSAEASQWKKDFLRAKGAEVIEHASDYGAAVKQGREEAKADPHCHFVDDENSRALFLGYATAAARLKNQLDDMDISVNAENPLLVYIPCGVGGAPGGICFGLKLIFGDSVRCCFAEPVEAPAVFLGLGTRLLGATSVQEINLSGHTAADGLAVSRPSALVCRAMIELVDSCATVSDQELFRLLAIAHDSEKLKLEPSALAGAGAYISAVRQGGLDTLARGTHIIWITGGGMLPEVVWRSHYEKGKNALQNASTSAAPPEAVR